MLDMIKPEGEQQVGNDPKYRYPRLIQLLFLRWRAGSLRHIDRSLLA
jgi:hypothetical protein